MTRKKNTSKRAEGVKVTGIAIDESVLKEVGEIAKYEYRSRNNMIELMLRDQVSQYKTKKLNEKGIKP